MKEFRLDSWIAKFLILTEVRFGEWKEELINYSRSYSSINECDLYLGVFRGILKMLTLCGLAFWLGFSLTLSLVIQIMFFFEGIDTSRISPEILGNVFLTGSFVVGLVLWLSISIFTIFAGGFWLLVKLDVYVRRQVLPALIEKYSTYLHTKPKFCKELEIKK